MIILEKEEDFNGLTKEGTVLVDFFATWCGPCKMLSPLIDEVAKEDENLKVIKVDVDQFDNLSMSHGIMSIPTLEVYKDGQLVKTNVGFIDKNAIKDLVK